MNLPTPDPFLYDSCYQIIVCTLCQQAVSPTSIKKHLAATLTHRRQGHTDAILEQCRLRDETPVRLQDVIMRPDAPARPVQGLPVFTDGL